MFVNGEKTMSTWDVKKGNTVVQDISVKDKDGVLVSNLAAASNIKFQIKVLKTGAALVEKSVGSGIEINTPSSGYLRLTLSAKDTNQIPDNYYIGLQITWGAEVREVILKVNSTEIYTVRIIQDVVNT